MDTVGNAGCSKAVGNTGYSNTVGNTHCSKKTPKFYATPLHIKIERK